MKRRLPLYKSLTRQLVLAVLLGTLSGTIAHADTTTSTSVTGTDPVPTSPHVVTVILTLLQTLL
jgi:hypothetical protein